MQENDPAVARIANVDELPQCPEDADDCQGFEDSVAGGQPTGPDPAIREQALQLVNSVAKDCTFDDEGATHSDEEYDQKVPYSGLTISLSNSGRTDSAFAMAMRGGDTLEVRGDFQTGSSDRACWFLNKSYAGQKQTYDQVISALKILGARAAGPREGFFDITGIGREKGSASRATPVNQRQVPKQFPPPSKKQCEAAWMKAVNDGISNNDHDAFIAKCLLL